jgi:hypothetical protein
MTMRSAPLLLSLLALALTDPLWPGEAAGAQQAGSPATGALAAGTAGEGPPHPLSRDAAYDPDIPTPWAVLGHDPSERITPPEEIVRYFEALADAAPERTRLVRYAETWQGRPLVLLAIGGPERMAAVDAVQEGLARLADPRGLGPDEAARLVADLPVVTALAHSVHGNEITPAGSSMVTAYHLLAATGDPEVELILRESIVLIDPVQNPDGRARFVAENQLGAAFRPDPDPVAAERDHPWPGSRSNHYLFDLNRDWFAHTQPESSGKVRAFLAWNPHVYVDLHEMGSNSTYYFPPSAVPGNPHTTPLQNELFELFGRENAAVFDERGWPYFIREIFDSFYPGYGASWPTAHGALGKTFEQASPRGMVVERYDGSHLTYAQGIEQNFHAAFRTALTAAENRERLLESFLEFRRSAVEEGRSGTRAYVLSGDRDPALADRLARTLAANGIEVRRTDEGFSAGGRSFGPGSYVVPLDQPAGRLARNLLDPQTDMDSAFVELQRERRAQRLPDQIYDVTAWSLPFLWNVEAIAVEAPVQVASTRVEPSALGEAAGGAGLAPTGSPGSGASTTAAARSPGASLPPARVGWLLPWGTAAAATVGQAIDEEIPLHAAGRGFTVGGRDFGVGTIHARAGELTDAQRDRLAELARANGAEVVPVDDAFVDAGMSLGSNQMRALPRGRVLLVWDSPASTLSAGWARWVLERRYGKSVTAVRASALGRAELSRFAVVVLPSGNYASAIGGGSLDRLRQWVQDGGTLVTMGESTRWAARDDVGFLSAQAELRAGSDRGGPAAAPDPDTQPIDLLEAIVPEREAPEPISGAILRAVMDTTHVLAAGAGEEMGVMVASSRVFTPLTLAQGTNVAVYAPLERLVMSGIVWEDARPQVASKAFLMHEPVGRGRVIAFAEDPNFRGYAEGTQLLFMNAVLLGPAF